jgi:hypothetical protein
MGCESITMLDDEIETIGWSYLKLSGGRIVVDAVWELVSGTSVELGQNIIDNDNFLVSGFLGAVELGISKIKTTATMSDDTTLVGELIVNVKGCECS